MATDTIFSLRPVDGSAAAISAAIERARAAQAEAEQAVAAAKQHRDAALLDAAPKDLAALERRLTDARGAAAEMAERIGAALAQLEARLAVAKRAEAVKAVETAAAEYEAAGLALATWWETHRDQLAEILRVGERLDYAVGMATRHHAATTARTLGLYPDEAFDHPLNTAAPTYGWQQDVTRMTEPAPPVRLVAPPTEEDQGLAERRRVAERQYQPQSAAASSRFATRA